MLRQTTSLLLLCIFLLSVRACPNDCSSNGECLSTGVCSCTLGYLSLDCSVSTSMALACPDPTFCYHWQIAGGLIFMRIRAETSTYDGSNVGWAGVLFNASDGMIDGSGFYVSIDENNRTFARDIFASEAQTQPDLLSDGGSIRNISGFFADDLLDVQLIRLLDPQLPSRTVIPASPGTTLPVFIAHGANNFTGHDGDTDLYMTTTVDFAHEARGNSCADMQLGLNCEVTALMQPFVIDTRLSLYWRVQNDYLYMRIKALTTPDGAVNEDYGYIGVLFGTSDGMSNGDGLLITISATDTSTPIIRDIVSYGKRHPSILAPAQTANISAIGYSSGTFIDVSFGRPLNTSMVNHTVLPSTAGSYTALSIAWHNVSVPDITRHTPANRNFYPQVDLVLVGNGGKSGCPNNCSSRGTCSKDFSCRCALGWLGVDCAVESTMSPMTFNDAFSLYWTIANGTVYIRMRVSVASAVGGGYGSIMFGATDGMTNGDAIVLFMSSTSPVVPREYYSTGKTIPAAATALTVVPANTTGFIDDEQYLDMSVQRLCDTGASNHYNISIDAVSMTTISVAWHDGRFQYHGKTNAATFSVNMMTGKVVAFASFSYLMYAPLLTALAVIVLLGLATRISCVRRSSIGICCLRRRIQSPVIIQADPTLKRLDTAVVASSSFTLLDVLTLDAVTTFYNLTYGEFLVIAVYLIGVIGMSVIAVAQFALMDKSAVYALAHLTAAHMAMTILPVTRNSVLLPLFAVSFERAIKWHRYIARITVVLLLSHALTMLDARNFDWTILVSTDPTASGNGVIYGTLTAVAVLIMAATALEPVRRRFFEAFLYLHVPLFVSAYVFASLHSAFVRYYIIPATALLGVDWLLRSYRAFLQRAVLVDAAVIETADAIGAVTKLTIRTPIARSCQAGQYVFIAVNDVAVMQYHPFSITAKDVEESTITLHCLDMGNNTWTRALADRVRTDSQSAKRGSSSASEALLANTQRLSVAVDGAYGALSLALSDYDRLIVVAGGIGITPLISIAQEFADSQRDVIFIWATKHAEHVQQILPDFILSAPNISVKCFITEKHSPRAHSDAEMIGAIKHDFGRPNLAAIFADVEAQAADADAVAVVTCGPPALVKDAQKHAMKHKFHFHKETFLL